MISTDHKIKLYNILDSLDNLSKRDEILLENIDEKLKISEESYETLMKDIHNYILMRDNLKVIKAMARLSKKGKQNEH